MFVKFDVDEKEKLMRTLCEQEILHISGANPVYFMEPENYSSYPLRVYLKRDALLGALGLGLLCSPAGLVVGSLGAIAGLCLGLGCGYLEWVVYQ
ncbi:MAG TPA: hypothetical protein VFP93_01810 [Gammaproteobacteria bacterium]|nr:hypothetical protein [Gammaproteobacteria bacterium]